MNLLYLIASLAGIALVVSLNVLLLGRVRPQVGDTAGIAARLRREIPGFRAGRSAIAADGGAALIENAASNTVILVRALGDGWVIRKLTRDMIDTIAREGTRLSLRLTDFTLPRAELSLRDETLAREWEARLKA